MGYRDIRQPSSPTRPDDDDDDDDDDYKAVFNKLPSPCRPDSPVLPPIDYGADRIQNDLLDEICSDIGIKVCFILIYNLTKCDEHEGHLELKNSIFGYIFLYQSYSCKVKQITEDLLI